MELIGMDLPLTAINYVSGKMGPPAIALPNITTEC